MKGFTLIELIVVVAILSVMAGVVAFFALDTLSFANLGKVHHQSQRLHAYTETLKSLGYPAERAAEKVFSHEAFSSFSLAEKVIGSEPFLSHLWSLAPREACKATHDIYLFLDKLDGSQTPKTYTNTGTLLVTAELISPTESRIVCMSNKNHFALAIAVRDGLWWCYSSLLTTSEGTSGYRIVRPGEEKDIKMTCEVHPDDSDYLFMSEKN